MWRRRGGSAWEACALAAFNRRNTLAADEALLLKLGLHTGPCIAVTMNGRVDYFGSAANIAARVEGLATGGEVILTDAVRQDPDAAQIVAQTTAAGRIDQLDRPAA